jgi:hypothetical protein
MATNKTPAAHEQRQESMATIFRRARTMDAPKLSPATLAKSFAKAASMLDTMAALQDSRSTGTGS